MAHEGFDWLPSERARRAMGKRLAAASADMTTTAVAEMNRRYPWFAELNADNRATVTLVARSGVDGFIAWFTRGDVAGVPENIFAAAPRALTRSLSLHQTVDLIRTTIETVERHITTGMPRGDRPTLQTAMLHYSREIAFGAAEVYARAAESRGAWDARVEALVMDAVVRGDADESVAARASTLGWRSPAGLTVVIGDLPERPDAVEELRSAALRSGLDVLAAPQGPRLFVVLGGSFTTDAEAVATTSTLVDHFGPGPVVVGPVVADLASAVESVRAASAGRRAAPAWPHAPRPVAARDLLPERALSGDGHARRQLAHDLYQPLVRHGGDLLGTLEAFFEERGSIEATARRLYVHANTVRYRLTRVEDLTGFSPSDPRDAYALRLALTLGRLLG